ncbi:MAG: ABC transporter permease [Beijerinckiaceae bacterium]|nr:ABC transporter permease [Beijerinckiaceae bacterium]
MSGASSAGQALTLRLSKSQKRLSLLVKIGVLVALLAIWHLVTVDEFVSPFFLPKPDEVLRVFFNIIVTGQAWPDLKVTLFEFALAGPIAVIAGGAVGFLISLTRYGTRAFEPIVSSVYAIPIIIFYPVSVMALGIGPESKIAHGALFGFFPMCLSTIQGFSRVDPLYIRLAHSTGASKSQLFWRIMLPAAAPTILTGVRLGLMLSFLAIIGGETIASLEGIGHRIVWYAEGMQTGNMFAYIVFVIMVAVLMNTALSFLEIRRGRQ